MMIAAPMLAALPSCISGVHNGEGGGTAGMGCGFAFLGMAGSGSSGDSLRGGNGAARVPERIPVAFRCVFLTTDLFPCKACHT